MLIVRFTLVCFTLEASEFGTGDPRQAVRTVKRAAQVKGDGETSVLRNGGRETQLMEDPNKTRLHRSVVNTSHSSASSIYSSIRPQANQKGC
jgi:hypothetical protein